jgi:hypothetical protein
MATPNCSTYGHPNCPRQDGQIINALTWLALTFCLGNFSLTFGIFYKKAVWQAQRVRPKAKRRGAVGNCRIGA